MNYSWEWHPAYEPINTAMQEKRLKRWERSWRRVESIAVPVAKLILPETDLALIAQNIRASGRYSLHNRGAHDNQGDPRLNECLTRSLDLLHEVAAADIKRSKANSYYIVTSDLQLENYKPHDATGIWHCDAETALPHMHPYIKYVAALLGPSTVFGEGKFRRTQFDETGDFLRPDARLPSWQPDTGTVTRFDSMSIHAAPNERSNPELQFNDGLPRLFMSLSIGPQ